MIKQLSSSLQQVIKDLGFEKLTPIQEQSIPVLLSGKDLVGESQTGSGKTAAFTIPILEKLVLQKRRVQAIILCPTRELCTQVCGEVRKLGRLHPSLHVLIVSGGLPSRPQMFALEKGVHIVVGTPGRVKDLLARGKLELSQVISVVLDEADRMLDMGFEEDMESILSALPKKRQTAFFSATYPNSIGAMSKKYQTNPVHIKIQSDESTKPQIRQMVYSVGADQKLKTLLWLLKQHNPQSAIVFCNQKETVKVTVKALESAGVSAAGIHGDLEQIDRDKVMAKFRNQSAKILVATDVAARGIDVSNLDIVFNYDLPLKPEVYVHRIGRTGRADKSGLAIALVEPREERKLKAVEEYTKNAIEKSFLASKEQIDKDIKSLPSTQQETKRTTLCISGGRKDKLRPGDILGALTGEAGGLSADDVGKIEIHDRHAYVAISSKVVHKALECLKEGRIKGRKFSVDKVI